METEQEHSSVLDLFSFFDPISCRRNGDRWTISTCHRVRGNGSKRRSLFNDDTVWSAWKGLMVRTSDWNGKICNLSFTTAQVTLGFTPFISPYGEMADTKRPLASRMGVFGETAFPLKTAPAEQRIMQPGTPQQVLYAATPSVMQPVMQRLRPAKGMQRYSQKYKQWLNQSWCQRHRH